MVSVCHEISQEADQSYLNLSLFLNLICFCHLHIKNRMIVLYDNIINNI